MARIEVAAAYAAIFLSLAGCASSLGLDDALAVAPYKVIDGGRIVVDVRIDDQGPFDFAIDTGASISVVFGSVRDRLDLTANPGESVLVHGMVASGRYPLLSFKYLHIGQEIWVGPKVASLPGDTRSAAAVDGILGIDFLRRFSIGFSKDDSVMRLYSPGQLEERFYRGWASIPLEPVTIEDNGAVLYLLTIEIAGEKVPALFDLGAGLNTLNWPAARLLRLERSDPGKNERLSGGIESTPVLARFLASDVTIRNIRWHNEEFLVGDLGIFAALRRENSPFVIVGSGLFSRRDFVIDLVRRRLLIKRSVVDENNSR